MSIVQHLKRTALYREFRNSVLYYPVRKLYGKIRGIGIAWKIRERVIRNKEGQKKSANIYIIWRPNDGTGFFYIFNHILSHIIYADKKGYIPVIDMENYSSNYNEEEPINGTMNCWEYYFLQPSGVDLKEAYSSSRYILSSGRIKWNGIPGYNQIFHKEEILALTPYLEKYIHIRPEILKEIEEITSSWPERVLGVHMRGTDMYTFPDHPHPPELEQFEEKIAAFLSEYGSGGGQVLLCTDEERMLTYMQERFGDAIICTNAYRSTDGCAIHTNISEGIREHHRYLLGKEVLKDALLLASCSDLICGYSNVANAAMMFNRGHYRSVIRLENKTRKFNTTWKDEDL